MGSTGTDKLILYTNHTCTCALPPNCSTPRSGRSILTRLTGANRADVALAELGVPFEERIINVDGPRPPEFLKINPRALVPVLIWNDEIIVESAIVCQFLVDMYPSHLCPPPTTSEGALRRASMSFFTDAYWTKFHTVLFRLYEAPTAADEEKVVDDAVQGLVREVEPLLGDAAPFFGKSPRLTLAEVSGTQPQGSGQGCLSYVHTLSRVLPPIYSDFRIIF